MQMRLYALLPLESCTSPSLVSSLRWGRRQVLSLLWEEVAFAYCVMGVAQDPHPHP